MIWWLGAVLLVVPMTVIGTAASGSMIGTIDRAPASRVHAVAFGNTQESVVDPEVTTEEATSHALSSLLPLARRLALRVLWTAAMGSVVFLPLAQRHAKWIGMEEEYRSFQRTLASESLSALRSIPGDTLSFFVGLPELVSSVYEQPSLLVELGVGMLEQMAGTAYTFATSDSDEEAAKAASSFVADIWFGKLLAASGMGTALAAKATRRTAKAFRHADDATRLRLRSATAGLCFAAGTLVHTPGSTRAIEHIELGQRVLTAETTEVVSTAVNERWRKLDLVMRDERSADGKIHIALLRSPAWIEETGAKEGAEIEIALEEMGVHGAATVLSIQAAPAIIEGSGRVVLATVRSKSTDVRVIRFRETSEKLELTGRHRLYSLDRHSFVAARDLRVGELLRTHTGAVTVASLDPKSGTHTVYNLEVETDHNYFVSDSALLSHNDVVETCAARPPRRSDKQHPAVDPSIWSPAVREQTLDAFKARLAELVDSKGMTRKEIALRWDFSAHNVRNHLRPNFRVLPSSDFLVTVARAENVSIDWLLGLRDDAPQIVKRTTRVDPGAWPIAYPQIVSDGSYDFKVRFTALALRANLSNRLFAERFGRSSNTAQLYVSGKSAQLPSTETLIVLAKTEGARIDWLLGLSNDGPAGLHDRVLAQASVSVAQGGRRAPRTLGTRREELRDLRAEMVPGFRRRMGRLMTGMTDAAYGRKVGLTNIGLLLKKENRLPSADSLIAIARIENVSADWLLGERAERRLYRGQRATDVAARPTPTTDTVKTRLASAVARAGDSHQAAAQALGIHPVTLDKYLSPTNPMLPSAEVLVSVARATNVRIDWLLGLID